MSNSSSSEATFVKGFDHVPARATQGPAATENETKLVEARGRMLAHQARWTPCGERLVAMELPRDEAKVGRIILSDAERDKDMLTRECEVLAVGPECAEFGVGDRIMVGMYAGKVATFTTRDKVLVLTPDEVLQRISAAELEQQAAAGGAK